MFRAISLNFPVRLSDPLVGAGYIYSFSFLKKKNLLDPRFKKNIKNSKSSNGVIGQRDVDEGTEDLLSTASSVPSSTSFLFTCRT